MATDPTVPDVLAGNLKPISYDATNKTVTAQVCALDSTPVDVVYTRDAGRDLNGYEANIVQEDSLDRFFVAMVGESTDSSTACCKAPYQKGTVENTNNRLRKYLPRSTEPTALTNLCLRAICHRLSSTPRKCLGYYTPAEVFESKLMEIQNQLE